MTHEHREHQQCEQRRPLQQKAEHDDNKADILRVPDILVDAGRRQCVAALRRVEILPGRRQQDEPAEDRGDTEKVQDTPMRVAVQPKYG